MQPIRSWADWLFWITTGAACSIAGYAIYERFFYVDKHDEHDEHHLKDKRTSDDSKLPESSKVAVILQDDDRLFGLVSRDAARFWERYQRLYASSGSERLLNERIKMVLAIEPTFDPRSIEPVIHAIPVYADLVRKSQLPLIRFLDLHVQLGSDMRRVLLDGARAEYVQGVVRNAEQWQCGCTLFEGKASRAAVNSLVQLSDSETQDGLGGAFDLVYSGGWMHHLSWKEVEKEVQFARNCLRSGSVSKSTPIPYFIGYMKVVDWTPMFEKMLARNGFVNVRVGSLSAAQCGSGGFVYWQTSLGPL